MGNSNSCQVEVRYDHPSDNTPSVGDIYMRTLKGDQQSIKSNPWRMVDVLLQGMVVLFISMVMGVEAVVESYA